jgi:succinyl-diaminopimelate desuccinylase
MSEVVELTRRLVRIETINPPGKEQAAAELVAARLERAGLEVRMHELAPGRPNLVARWRGRSDAPALCLTGHLDTVPLGAAAWSCDPLAAELSGDRLFGRGTSDMKGGIAAIVVAVERVAALGRGRAGLEVVITAGEETGCEGALALARGAGVLSAVGAILVAEPTSNYPCLGHKGMAWLDVKATGVSAHGSMPELGENAIAKLAHAITAIESWRPGPADPLLGSPTLNVGVVAGGNAVNLVPDWATANVDLRTVPGEQTETAIARIRELLGPEVIVEGQLALAPVVTDASQPWVQEVFDVMAPLIGERPVPRGLTYFTDAAALAPAYGNPAAIVCGPGDPEQAHQTDESCSVARLEVAADGFAEIARRWCGL